MRSDVEAYDSSVWESTRCASSCESKTASDLVWSEDGRTDGVVVRSIGPGLREGRMLLKMPGDAVAAGTLGVEYPRI